jgi:hypothetical protein
MPSNMASTEPTSAASGSSSNTVVMVPPGSTRRITSLTGFIALLALPL